VLLKSDQSLTFHARFFEFLAMGLVSITGVYMSKKNTSRKGNLPTVAKPLTAFERDQLIVKSKAYTEEVLSQRVVYPDPEDFDNLAEVDVQALGFTSIDDTDLVSLFKRHKRNKGGKKGGGKSLPNPLVVEAMVRKLVGRMPVLDGDGMTGNLIMGECNFEFGSLSKAKFFQESYRLLVERHHLIFASEVEDQFLDHLATLGTGYKSFCSVANTRNQAVGFVVHPRLKVLGQTSYDDVGTVQGIPDLRPAFRLDLEDTVTGDKFAVVVVHLKSMRGGMQVSGKVRYQQCHVLATKLGKGFVGVIAGDWNTFLDRTNDLDPLYNAGFRLIAPNNTEATHIMGGRLDGYVQLNMGGLGCMKVRQLFGDPIVGRAFTDHGLVTVKNRPVADKDNPCDVSDEALI
jgi:hypothetical protein